MTAQMLLSFRFANHRSFADEQQLNLTPVYASRRDVADPHPAVRVIGIFGANASGKSNSLAAFSFMRHAVLYSDRVVEPGVQGSLEREPFVLDSEISASPSRYVVDLDLSGVRYTYGFSIDDERIVEEWLYHYPLKKRRRVFERDGDSFTWGEETKKDADLERISSITAPTALYISTIARFSRRKDVDGEPQPLHEVYSWFRRARTRPGPRVRNLSTLWLELGAESQAPVVELLRAADVGIVDVLVSETLPGQDPMIALEDETKDVFNHRNRRQLLFVHQGPTGRGLLNLRDESTGTQQLLDLAIDASIVLRRGGIMTVDEIDASLHPMLTAKLIALFHSDTANPHGSQLIFTSHDASLLGTFDTEEILDRDEIWFAEKAKDGTSTVYPLTDFKPRREGENRQRRYLNGSYGGVPELSMVLFERALATRDGSGGHEES
ncbi:AAA family ATPase [Actinoplanes sp. CA-054009]